jgi:hypothetical protein
MTKQMKPVAASHFPIPQSACTGWAMERCDLLVPGFGDLHATLTPQLLSCERRLQLA